MQKHLLEQGMPLGQPIKCEFFLKLEPLFSFKNAAYETNIKKNSWAANDIPRIFRCSQLVKITNQQLRSWRSWTPWIWWKALKQEDNRIEGRKQNMALTAEDRNAWKAVQEERQSSMQTNIVSVHHLDNLLFKHFAALKVDEISRRSRDFDVDGKSDQSIPDGRSEAVADSIDCDVQRLCEITQLLSKENEHLQSQFHEMDYALQVSKSEKQSLQEELNTSKNTIESLQEVEVKMQLAIQSLHNCEQTIATLQQEKAELQESVAKLETKLHNVCDHVCHMDEQNKDLISQIEMLAGKVLILENYVCKSRENIENENPATTGRQDDNEESAIDHQHDTQTCKSLALVQEANSIQPTMALPEQNENTMENEEEDAKLDLGGLTVCLLDGLAKVEEELERWKENSRGLEFALVTAKAQRTSNLLVRYAVPAATTAFLAGLIVINAKSSKHPS